MTRPLAKWLFHSMFISVCIHCWQSLFVRKRPDSGYLLGMWFFSWKMTSKYNGALDKVKMDVTSRRGFNDHVEMNRYLGRSPPIIVVDGFFWNFPWMYPNSPASKNSLKEKSVRIGVMMGQPCPIHFCAMCYFIGLQYILRKLEARVLKMILEWNTRKGKVINV